MGKLFNYSPVQLTVYFSVNCQEIQTQKLASHGEVIKRKLDGYYYSNIIRPEELSKC